MAYSFVVAFAIAFAIKKTMGIRISPEDEESGIDAKLHRDAAYELQTLVETGPDRRDSPRAGRGLSRCSEFPTVIL